jgi:hypothetical protein
MLRRLSGVITRGLANRFWKFSRSGIICILVASSFRLPLSRIRLYTLAHGAQVIGPAKGEKFGRGHNKRRGNRHKKAILEDGANAPSSTITPLGF